MFEIFKRKGPEKEPASRAEFENTAYEHAIAKELSDPQRYADAEKRQEEMYGARRPDTIERRALDEGSPEYWKAVEDETRRKLDDLLAQSHKEALVLNKRYDELMLAADEAFAKAGIDRYSRYLQESIFRASSEDQERIRRTQRELRRFREDLNEKFKNPNDIPEDRILPDRLRGRK